MRNNTSARITVIKLITNRLFNSIIGESNESN